MRRGIVVALLAFVVSGLSSSVFAASYSLTTIDVPFAGASFTTPMGINKKGRIVGTYLDNGRARGFSDDDGEFATIDVPGAYFTYVNGINDRGEIVGRYSDVNGNHGFVNFKNRFTAIDFPGAIVTYSNGINNRGQIVGWYYDGSGNHGFLLKGGKFSTIDFPGVGYTYANGVDNEGQVVGYASPTDLLVFGFLDSDNVFTTLDFSAYPSVGFTVANGINSGLIVGEFARSNFSPPVGFVVPASAPSPPSPDQIFSFPDAPYTSANGINSNGDIVGSYDDSSYSGHGFLALPQ